MRLEKVIYNALKNANDDNYVLSLMVSKRANELAEGAEPLIKADKNKTTCQEQKHLRKKKKIQMKRKM